MQAIIQEILDTVRREAEAAQDTAALEALRVAVSGKKGRLTELLRGMGQLPPEERPAMGARVNEAREAVAQILAERQAALQALELERRIEKEAIDVTEPRPARRIGTAHPLNMALDELVEIFIGLGYEVVEGPEIELDHYNFELLNLPKNHPARDAQDTLYIEDNIVLRTHTSPVQARTMTTRRPPIRIICPGRVFRADEADATHSPNFHQMEGLLIDKNISMADLKGTLDAFAKGMYGEDITTRFRPSFFPFTEPSAEVDLTCMACRGKGCRVCKGTGWIELLGCGMVNPKVLAMCGIDPAEYTGFAFGIGLERIAMMKYGINDLRYLYEGDLRFLGQFRQGGAL
ncbi:MAG: phenylalanine--tRNA ligase subunit alpha [Oscillospiraceae bacterium]|jgi:phenylalanyl-tRNA synthetase alpha chain|nr:phenylalanine--tRNA ligase subunit alpha [Oscillospiraceae bacterium]